MNWLDRFAAWFIRQVDGMPNLSTGSALRRYERLGNALAGFAPDYTALVNAAKKGGARTTQRKRKGAVVVIIDFPARGDDPPTRLRLKFKEKK